MTRVSVVTVVGVDDSHLGYNAVYDDGDIELTRRRLDELAEADSWDREP